MGHRLNKNGQNEVPSVFLNVQASHRYIQSGKTGFARCTLVVVWPMAMTS